ncbi:hypothetical protein GOP47_0020122 [Adiantum capillus-veneris]|uniref:Uncharacterized protein n=1 Tax=Adiantum capillus-veneris TaxID=13818 RepID=A0A9D4UD23_ADICA|nr:hypothetical protein GOP47_0020122 [Adiantum capillus-veneris]
MKPESHELTDEKSLYGFEDHNQPGAPTLILDKFGRKYCRHVGVDLNRFRIKGVSVSEALRGPTRPMASQRVENERAVESQMEGFSLNPKRTSRIFCYLQNTCAGSSTAPKYLLKLFYRS